MLKDKAGLDADLKIEKPSKDMETTLSASQNAKKNLETSLEHSHTGSEGLTTLSPP